MRLPQGVLSKGRDRGRSCSQSHATYCVCVFIMGLWGCGGGANPLHNLEFATAEPHGPNLAMDSTQLQLQPPKDQAAALFLLLFLLLVLCTTLNT